MDSSLSSWIFCQIGAREHYALPAEFHRKGRLAALYTDLWVPPASVLRRLPLAALAGRYEPSLADATVRAFTWQALAFETRRRLLYRGEDAWTAIMARNAWFQRQVLADLPRRLKPGMTVFSYSYAALDIFRAARAAGCRTVLGQIDPAVTEEQIVARACAAHADLNPRWTPAPPAYWDLWREECALADHIMVNSEWSRTGLIEAEIQASKIDVLPLAYETSAAAPVREWPTHFSAERPLRVLFLGSLIVRKGIVELLAAARALAGQPVEFLMVGSLGVEPLAGDRSNPQIRWIGPVSRGEVGRWYEQADVFILPSLSDGFGLTMLEAQARGLPVIASRYCGDVVQDGLNGLLLDSVTGGDIAQAVRHLLNDPAGLAKMSAAAIRRGDSFRSEIIADRLAHAARQSGMFR